MFPWKQNQNYFKALGARKHPLNEMIHFWTLISMKDKNLISVLSSPLTQMCPELRISAQLTPTFGTLNFSEPPQTFTEHKTKSDRFLLLLRNSATMYIAFPPLTVCLLMCVVWMLVNSKVCSQVWSTVLVTVLPDGWVYSRLKCAFLKAFLHKNSQILKIH